MAKKPARNARNQSPIDARQKELERKQAELKAKLNHAQSIIEKAPEMKAEIQRRVQRSIFERYSRPSRIEGPADFRLEFVGQKAARPPRQLRKERSLAPFVTLLLLAAFGVVAYYAWRVMWHS